MSMVCSQWRTVLSSRLHFLFPPLIQRLKWEFCSSCATCVVLRRHNCNVTQHESCQHLKRLFWGFFLSCASHSWYVEDKSVITQVCQIALQSPECAITEAICTVWLCGGWGSRKRLKWQSWLFWQILWSLTLTTTQEQNLFTVFSQNFNCFKQKHVPEMRS